MKKLLIILMLFTLSCGYKPIFSKNDELILEFNKIITNGDKRINKQIFNNINIKENLSNNRELSLNTIYNIEETSKNSKGQVTTYRSIISTTLIITKDNKVIKSKYFINDFSYNNKDNKYELTKYQNEIKNNLISELSEEIILFLKLL
tara:strand:- start:2382 stop:2825 length:444 start_codon:yes stop_codon:yes gene_type:complete